MSTRELLCWVVMIGVLAGLTVSDARAEIGLNSLRLVKDPVELQLTWTAGLSPYGIYRAELPDDIVVGANLVATTAVESYADPSAPLAAERYFYQVAEVPPAEPECELLATPDLIELGEVSSISWSSSGGVSATLDGRTVDLSGALDLSPVGTTTYSLEVIGAAGTTPAVCEATLTLAALPPCSESDACMVWCGSGRIEQIATAEPIWLDAAEMVHVLMLPEGYLAGELSSGRFDADIDNWIDEWDHIEPYAAFREAFCIWKLPKSSAELVEPSSPQTADTAFLVPITDDGNGIASSIPYTGPTSVRVWEAVEAGFPLLPTAFYPTGGRTSKIAKNLVVVMLVFDEDVGRSGLSGRARRLENPLDSSQRISAAFAHNRPHEFSHAFSRLNDEYMEDCCGALCATTGPDPPSRDLTNVVCEPQCDRLPWSHLLNGTVINPATDELVGSFGVDAIGFHPELKCLMNGTHDNSTYYGGDGRLRVYDRFCNFCREVTAFRLFERIGQLDDVATSWETWTADYRDPFFERFGFETPDPVPQENSAGTPIYEACPTGFGHHEARSSILGASDGGCDIVDE